MNIPKDWTQLPPAEIAEKLCTQWIKDERQYRAQVSEARAAGTPWSAMMAHADQLSECRRALQVVFGLVMHPDKVDELARGMQEGKP